MDDTTTMSNQATGEPMMSPAVDQLATALSKCQTSVLSAIKDTTNAFLTNKYADLASVWNACRDALGKEGLAIVQGGVKLVDSWVLRTTLLHASGQWIQRDVPIIHGTHKGINEMQALGLAITYARRYGLTAMVGVVQEDDDGNGSGPRRGEDGAEQSAQPRRESASTTQPRRESASTTQFGQQYIAMSAQTAGSLMGKLNAALSLEEQKQIVGGITKEITALLTPEDLQRVRQSHSACTLRLQQLAAKPVTSS